jgi:8-amino-7-oxononanoate synthase
VSGPARELQGASAPTDEWAAEELRRLSSLGLRRELEPIDSPQGAEVQIAGRAFVNFSSNDYLGLASNPALAKACASAAQQHGVGSGASRLLVGDTASHHALERALAHWMNSDRALLFSSGYAANVGILSSLVGGGDVIFSDELNHASLIDGCRLSRASTVIYPHCDLGALARLLQTHRGRRRLVCSESIFSMDGDRAPVRELAELCAKFEAGLMIDEAHAIGTVGPRGAGACAEAGLTGSVAVRMGTLGKALGAFGAFAAVSAPVAELLINRARTLIYSTALPIPICEAARVAVALASTGALQARLWRNLRRFSEGLLGIGIRADASSCIFPVVLGAPERALAAAKYLRSRGLLVKAIRPPTVPAGTSRLRFSVCASHTDEHIDLAIDALQSLELENGR